MTVINKIDCYAVIKNICVNSTADIVDGKRIGNPTECALLEAVGDYTSVRKSADIVSVTPFTSEAKMMSTTVRAGADKITFVKGSPERIMELCGDYSAESEILEYQQKACRIIAFGDSVNGGGFVFRGFAAITDPLRADVFEAVDNCRNAGISLKILTGDNIVTAKAIGEELGLLDNNALAVEARELEDLSDEALSGMLPRIRIIARSTPTIKMRIVKLLKELGHVVAVTGDGINDAPAIKNADVGIAMGITGTEVSKEAADIVLLDDSFATIAKSVKWGRSIYENFRRFIVFQLTVNLSTVIVVLASILFGFGAPFTALQLLWINIIMDGPPAIALGLEPVPKTGDLMKRRPTKRSAPIVSGGMLCRIIVISVFVVAVFMSQRLLNPLGASSGQESTVLFALFSTFKLFNALNSRELGRTSIFRNFFANRLVLYSVGIAFAAQIAIVQYGGAFFRTVPLSLEMWVRIIAVAASVVLVSELLRLVSLLRFVKQRTSE
jgi:Ca2+-transporting ATPase